MEFGARAVERIEEALREIAVLFIALAPLDVFLGEDRAHAVRNGFVFVGIGVFMLAVGLFVERRRLRG